MGDACAITHGDQVRWWASESRREGFACLLVGDPPVGYGMLRRRADGRRWVSLVVDPGSRGRGIGSEIYRALARIASPDERIYAGIRRDNVRSIAAATRAGYAVDDVVLAPAPDPGAWIVMRGSR